jgi:hypothetical protein
MAEDSGKPLDRRRPFRRINSRQVQVPRPDGDGFKCGCRSPDQVDKAIFASLEGAFPIEKAIANVPSWIPVCSHDGLPIDIADQPRELEGTLVRSFQTWTDTPLWQWHKWYDWNFHVQPAPEYEFLCVKANRFDPAAIQDGFKPVVAAESVIECEWDCGAFGAKPVDSARTWWGPMFESNGGWPWPMTGEWIWVAGRWIYDCGHPKDGLTHTELHPCLAVAFARWEAVQFDANEFPVPAIQFIFFASRLGGYHEFRSLTGNDYEFVVDLPPGAGQPRTAPIGHTPDFAMNTLVLPGYPLRKFDSAPFRSLARTGPNGFFAGFEDARPVIELIPSKDPAGRPVQAKVKIPLTQLKANEQKSGRKLDAYGVIISLGWSDPGNLQARRVKKCTVTFHGITAFNNEHPVGFLRNFPIPIIGIILAARRKQEGDWIIKLGVNGRWFDQFLPTVKVPKNDTKTYGLGKTFVFFLDEDDEVQINSHGASFTEPGIGDFMNKKTDADRVLRFVDGTEVDYERDAVCRDNRLSPRLTTIIPELFGSPPVQRHLMLWEETWMQQVLKLSETLSFENDPLGFIDPGVSAGPQPFPNPVAVRTWDPGLNGHLRRLRGFQTIDEGELQEHPGKPEYELVYSIALERVIP